MTILILNDTRKISIISTSIFFWQPKKDYWTLFSNANDDEDWEDHNENRAEGEAELTAMIFYVFARLFDEKSNFLAAC